MVIESLYTLLRAHVDREVFTQAKARRSSDAPLQWCMLYASSSTVYVQLQNWKYTSSSAEQSIGAGDFTPCVPDHGWPGCWAMEIINSTTTLL